MAGIMLGLAGWTLTAPAAAQGCPSQQEIGVRPAIEVQTSIPAAQYRNDVPRDQLGGMMRKQGSNATGHGTVLGLTYGTYDAKWSIQAFPVRRGGHYCHYLKAADVRLQIPSLIVYIAAEYRQGSCQFQVITNHENEHVRVNQYVLRKYAPLIRDALIREAARVLPISSAEPNAAIAIQAALQPVIEKLLAEMYRERDQGNAGIDTNYQYKRAAEQCARW